MLVGMKERMTARTVSVETHLSIPWSSATDMPKVDLPVPVQPPMMTSLGASSDDFLGENIVARVLNASVVRPWNRARMSRANILGVKKDEKAFQLFAIRFLVMWERC